MSADESTVLRWWRAVGEPDFGDAIEPILEIHPATEQPRAFEPVLICDLDEDEDEAPEITIH